MENIVEVRSAYKRYTSKRGILRGLNMTVEKGTVYGLLGPSGCGKTTLLVCMTGYKRLDSGSIHVHLGSRSQLGYMPQVVALIELFSVSEMLQYFGKVYGLKRNVIKERGRDLLHLMDLDPDTFWNRSINSMSGGQQRRVSLAVAMLHDPLLLILDEPTAGLDPVLILKLWDFFRVITKEEDKTIIITTHYIEETRRADTIGLMRNGVLLAETHPDDLMAQYSCVSLEDAFLLLSKKQNESEENEILPKKRKSVKPAIQLGALYDGHRIGAQIYKNLCWSKRNVPMTVFILMLPALMMFLFCTVYSDNLEGVVIAVVLEEVLPHYCNSVGPLPRCTSESRFSCHFVQSLQDRYYTVKEYQSLLEGEQALKHGKARALLRFNRDYTPSMLQLFTQGATSPQEYIEKCTIDANLDMSELTISMKIKTDISESFAEMARFIFSECGWSVRASEPMLRIEEPIFGDRSPKFIHTALAGFIIPFTFFITSFFAASSIISEKINGFLERCLISGVRQTEVMLAYTVMQVIMLTGNKLLLGMFAVFLQDFYKF